MPGPPRHYSKQSIIELLESSDDEDDDENNVLLKNSAPVFNNNNRPDVKPKPKLKAPPPPSASAAAATTASSSSSSSSEVLTLVGTAAFWLRKDGSTAAATAAAKDKEQQQEQQQFVLVRAADGLVHAHDAQTERFVGHVMQLGNSSTVTAVTTALGVVLHRMSDALKVTATTVRTDYFGGGSSDWSVPIAVNFWARSDRTLSSFERQPLEDSIRRHLVGAAFHRADAVVNSVKPEAATGSGSSAIVLARRVSASPTNSAELEEDDKKPSLSAAASTTTAAGGGEKVLLGNCDFTVVGTQFYLVSELRHAGEVLRMVREPDNAYDRGAVRFDTTDGSETKIGHLQREQAKLLAPILDTMSTKIAPTATVQGKSKRSVTVKIRFYTSGRGATGQSEIDSLRAILDERLGYYFRPEKEKKAARAAAVPVVPAAAAAAVKPDPAAATAAMLESMVDPDGVLDDGDRKPSAAGSAGAKSEPEVLMSTVNLDSQNTDQLDEMFDRQAQDKLANLPNYPMPPLLARNKIKLFDHQVDGIRWLIHQERGDLPSYMEESEQGGPGGRKMWKCKITNCGFLSRPSPVRGGILADDMGLGKTLQTIGLILSNPPAGIPSYPIPPGLRNGRGGRNAAPRCTLILSPLSVMVNWKLEINKQVNQRVNNKNLTVAIYHGPDRENQLVQVRHGNIDVLLASYHTVAADYKKYWGEDDDEEKRPALKKRKKIGPNIFETQFHRIVLDEAHIIRSSKTGLFKAAILLDAPRKLCLTGTPFVNKPTDILSLLSFLGVQPLATPKVFERLVVAPIKNRREIGLATVRTTMAHVALRRVKNEVEKNIDLVSKTVHYTTITFPPDNEHKEAYDDLYTAARDCFLGLLRMGDDFVMSRFMEVLALVLRIRQSCVHLALIPEDYRKRAAEIRRESSAAGADQMGMSAELGKEEGDALLERLQGFFRQSNELVECTVCFGELEEDQAIILRQCKHIFCEPCLRQIQNCLCPMCRKEYTAEDMIKKQAAKEATQKEKIQAHVVVTKHGRSPKIQAMLDTIDAMKSDEKAVIFSQWTKTLDIIEFEFRELGHSFTRIDGSMNAQERYDAMEAFDTDGCYSSATPRFVLCSLHACGTGINLTRANVVFLLDPWWNVAAENQAMDRVHRISQKRPVRVYRLVMKDSIEERLVKLQESKAALGKGALQKLDPAEKRKARLTTLRDLFQVPEDEEWK